MVTRAEHREQTLLTLGNAALEVFSENGPKATVDQIAERAGVSRRTIFRWVDSKEQLAWVHPILWFDVFDKAIAEIEADDDLQLDLAARLGYATRAIATYIDAAPDGPRQGFLVAAFHPFLVRSFHEIHGKWVDRIAAEVFAHEAEPNAKTMFKSRVIGGAVMGMVDACMREWMMSPEGASFTEIFERGYALLTPLFEQFRDDQLDAV